MRLAQMDFLAVNQHSFLHAWPVAPKLIAGLILLIGIVAARSPLQVALLLGLLLVVLIGARLPLWLLTGALYPAFFSFPFALARLAFSPLQAMVVVGKAATAALLLIMLLATTPFPQLFAFIGRLLPRLVVDGLFFTYRLFFLSLLTLESLLSSLRHRGAFARGNRVWSGLATLQAVGYLVIDTIATSQRLEQNYRLRGYDTGIYTSTHDYVWRVNDGMLLALLLAVVGGVLWLG